MKRNHLYAVVVTTTLLAGVGYVLLGGGKVALPEEVAAAYAELPDEIDYNRDVKRILSDKCFSCHGPDAKKQKADLRLDIASFAYGKVTESGLKAVRPGNPSKSELVHRILSADPEVRMPTPESHLQLTAREKAILVKWVEQGAEYKPHWAFVAPVAPRIPEVRDDRRIRNTIDNFIQSRIEQRGLKPAQEADRETLIRRLSFDLRGIAPDLREVEAFVADKSPDAYEKLVDRYLSSPHYGERMAAYWLDVARYADSHGYLDDKHRDMSPWREWVVSAYNRNLPFDRFITWQMAGDLLPNATQEQILATGFNRNHKQNSEAGIIEEEFRVEYVTDRTNTLGTALMAMTLGCAKCHDHKYDPVSTKDYYSLFAFFNSTFEKGGPNYGDEKIMPGPNLLLTSPEQEREIGRLQASIKSLEREETKRRQSVEIAQRDADEAAVGKSLSSKLSAKLDFDRPIPDVNETGRYENLADKSAPARYRFIEKGEGPRGASLRYNVRTLVELPPTRIGYFERYEPFAISLWIKAPAPNPHSTVFYSSEHYRYGYQGYDLLLRENRLNFRLSHNFPHDAVSVVTKERLAPGKWHHVAVNYDGSSRANGVTIHLDGKPLAHDVEYDNLKRNIRQRYSIHKGPLRGIIFGEKSLDKSMPGGEVDEFHVFTDMLTTREVGHLHALKPFPTGKGQPAPVPVSALMQERMRLCAIYDTVKQVMVMGDLPKPRPTFVLQRGMYNSPGDRVEPGTPASILAFPAAYPKNRLGLSQWLFDERNPLTARVAVNRLWQLIFGRGIVETSDDFGNQGSPPTHPELLDHLAIRYREQGWDTKGLIRYIVLSATYRQSSVNEEAVVKADPGNELLTRSPRYRLPAEMIRDNALSVAGLLSARVGGESAYPYQPDGLWEELSDKAWRYRYVLSEGDGIYRKSIYTVRKRTSVVPFLQIFDAPDRSVCTVRRTVSSSPMQPLAMLNDPQMVEAARFIALRMQREAGGDTDAALQLGFRLITGRRPSAAELAVLKEMHAAEAGIYGKDPEKVRALLSNGRGTAATADEAGLAALANTALALMNTDEFLTRK